MTRRRHLRSGLTMQGICPTGRAVRIFAKPSFVTGVCRRLLPNRPQPALDLPGEGARAPHSRSDRMPNLRTSGLAGSAAAEGEGITVVPVERVSGARQHVLGRNVIVVRQVLAFKQDEVGLVRVEIE